MKRLGFSGKGLWEVGKKFTGKLRGILNMV